MRSGLIVYVFGKEPPHWDAASELMAVKKNNKVYMVEIITVHTGHFDILEASNPLFGSTLMEMILKLSLDPPF